MIGLFLNSFQENFKLLTGVFLFLVGTFTKRNKMYLSALQKMYA